MKLKQEHFAAGLQLNWLELGSLWLEQAQIFHEIYENFCALTVEFHPAMQQGI